MYNSRGQRYKKNVLGEERMRALREKEGSGHYGGFY